MKLHPPLKLKYKQWPSIRFGQWFANKIYRNEKVDFTFEDWWLMWGQNHYWANIGTGEGKYSMWRIDANKPWSKTNVVIATRPGRWKPKNQPPVNSRTLIKFGSGHKAKYRSLVGNGVPYESLTQAARNINCHCGTIKYRITSNMKKWDGWYYTDGKNNIKLLTNGQTTAGQANDNLLT